MSKTRVSKTRETQLDLFEHRESQTVHAEGEAPNCEAGQLAVDSKTESARTKEGGTPNSRASRPKRPAHQRGPFADRFLSDSGVAKRYRVLRQTIWRWVRSEAEVPAPIKFAAGTSRWAVPQLEEFERGRKDASARKAGRAGRARHDPILSQSAPAVGPGEFRGRRPVPLRYLQEYPVELGGQRVAAFRHQSTTDLPGCGAETLP